MRLYTAAQMRSADAAAEAAGMPTLLLMEAAGRAVASAAAEAFEGARTVLVLCGKGNNGGDGYVAARYLAAAGMAATVLELAPRPAGGDAASARGALLAHGTSPEPLTLAALRDALTHADLVVDALLGSGLDRPVEGELAALLTEVAASGLPVLAVDVPSGVASDSPVPPGVHLEADLTVQLAGAKLASAFFPARAAFGETVVADIGIPQAVLEQASPVRLLDAGTAAGWLPARAPDAHKMSAGTVLVVAGSPRYLGAAELACRGAYRGGAGLVTLAAAGRAPSGWPEVVLEPLDWDDPAPLAALADLEAKRVQAAVIGPGLDPRALPWLPELLRRLPGPTVLDAGALATDEAVLQAIRAHGRCVLTPHVGEAARLLGRTAEQVLAEPLASAAELAHALGAVCVLKLAGAVVAAPDGRLAVSTRGHPGMAVGGAGDVLAGLLGALLAGGDPFERACAATYLHGRAGELAGERRGVGLIADDVANALPAAALELAC